MPHKQLNVRVSLETRRDLDWLKSWFGESEGEVVSRALALLYERTKEKYENPDPIMVRLAEDEAIEMHNEEDDSILFDDDHPNGIW